MTVDSTLASPRSPGGPVGPRPVPELLPHPGGTAGVGADAGAAIALAVRPAPVAAPAPPGVAPAPRRATPLGTGVRPSSRPDVLRPAVVLGVVLGVSVLVGHIAGTQGRVLIHDKMLPWILGRSLGIATYVALTAMVVLGLWLRHPWRGRFRRPRPESILRAHVTLAACTVALLAGHLTSLALDRYAGVGWTGVFVPWGAQFKPTGVAIGTLAFYALVLVAGTAALAGSIGRAVWFPIHTASVVVFCLCLVHGVLAGSDSVALRWVYVVSGATVLVLQFTRWLAGTLRHGPAVVDA